jgi:hypothetical protein
MLPSPSLGPPLLSASPSPPPFCGIADSEPDAFVEVVGSVAVVAGVDVVGVVLDEGVVAAGAGVLELVVLELPQPAAISAISTTLSAVRRRTLVF